jgi:hypothetical protein
MLRKKEEIIDVGPTILASSVREQRIGVLQLPRIELVDRNGTALFQEEAPIEPAFEEFEDRSGRLAPMSVFRFDHYWLAVFKKFNRTIQHVQLVSFDVNLHKGHVLMNNSIKASI